MARGFQQKHVIEYKEVFSSMARHETIRLVTTLACSKGWGMYHMDVKSVFLNGSLEETIFISQSPGFEIKGKETMVYHLHKAIWVETRTQGLEQTC